MLLNEIKPEFSAEGVTRLEFVHDLLVIKYLFVIPE